MLKIGNFSANNALVSVSSDNEIKVYRVTNPVAQPISQFALYLANKVPGHFAAIGLYDLNENRVADSGPISTNPSGNTNIIGSTRPAMILPAGEYYYAVTASSTGVELLGQVENAEGITLANGTGVISYGRAGNRSVNGQLPATLGGILPDSGPLPGAVFA